MTNIENTTISRWTLNNKNTINTNIRQIIQDN